MLLVGAVLGLRLWDFWHRGLGEGLDGCFALDTLGGLVMERVRACFWMLVAGPVLICFSFFPARPSLRYCSCSGFVLYVFQHTGGG